ncbi:hypothetical protein F5887DRAFT_1235992 [Amanita rubescens]|nr:hypothetical protein F5887DRAFT_1235992 [Amanita rubescens]
MLQGLVRQNCITFAARGYLRQSREVSAAARRFSRRGRFTRVYEHMKLKTIHQDVSQDQEGQGRAACGTEIKIHRLLTLSPFTTASMPSASNSNMRMGSAAGRAIASSIAQQKAVQSGSPISALLSSARQPLLVSSTGNIHDRNGPGRDARDSPLLMRKFQAAQGGSPLRRVAKMDADAGEDEEMRARKEPESQKAWIAAQMAPVREADGDDVPFLMPWITSPEGMNSPIVLRKRQGISSGKAHREDALAHATGTKLVNGSSTLRASSMVQNATSVPFPSLGRRNTMTAVGLPPISYCWGLQRQQ